jgi:hypothetical protein
MLPRIAAPLLAAAVLIYACSPRTPAAQRGLSSHVMVDTAGGDVRFVIEVANGSRKQVELDFPNGHTHDFIVFDVNGREVWRWSAGRMFTQGMQNRLLESNDSVVYAERWRPTAGGQYTLVAQLHSDNFPVQQRVDFALP